MKAEPVIPCKGCEVYIPSSEVGAQLKQVQVAQQMGLIFMDQKWLMDTDKWTCTLCQYENETPDYMR